MKKIFFATILMLLSLSAAKAQSIFDISGLNTPRLNGTARYMGMAGSFGALGGDASAILDNPAALGIFRSNELNFSTDIHSSITSTLWGTNAHRSLGYGKLIVPNFSWITNFMSNNEYGYLASNFSFSFNRIKNFNRYVKLSHQGLENSLTDLIADMTNGLYEKDLEYKKDIYDPFDNTKIAYLSVFGFDGYLIDPVVSGGTQWKSAVVGAPAAGYKLHESGHIDDYNFTYSGNVNDNFYFGLGLSLQTYSRFTNATYSENFSNGDFSLTTRTNYSGTGVNMNFGVIARLLPGVRVGASLQTPTYYSFHTTQKAELVSNVGAKQGSLTSPSTTWHYDYRSPLKAQLSAGFVIGSSAAINIDYMLMVGRTQRYSLDEYPGLFDRENADFRNYALSTHTLKVGAEVRVSKHARLRGGFGYITAPMSEKATKSVLNTTAQTDMEYFIDKAQWYASGGFGLNFSNLFIDFAYVYNKNGQIFTPFEMNKSSIRGDVMNNNHHIVATLAIKY